MITDSLVVAIPVLGRAERVERVALSWAGFRTLFLPDPDDEATVEELHRLRVEFAFAPEAPEFGRATYATKINHAYRVTRAPFLLYASDDVVPEVGWWDAARARLRDERVGLLATNDRSNVRVQRGQLATHGIIRRAYVERYGSASLPGAGPILHEGYGHWCVDVEVSDVARARGAFAYAPDVVLRHDHWMNRRAAMDGTYRLGRSTMPRDKALYAQRKNATDDSGGGTKWR